MADRDAVFPAGRHALYERHRYSAAVRAGGMLYVSGQVGTRDDGSPEEGIDAQVRRAFANLTATLAAADLTFADVIDVTMFVVDPEANVDRVLAIMPEFWGDPPYPALTAVGVTWLSGFLFEVKAIARLAETAS